MKKGIKILIGSILMICILLGLGYLGLAVYYENGFSFGTYINGIYCTGKSVETVNQELNDALQYDGLKVVTKDGTFYVDAEDISYAYNYREPLNYYLQQQNPYLWIENLFGHAKEYELLPTVTYDETALLGILEDEIAKYNLPSVYKVTLQSGESGFELTDTKLDILDRDKFTETVKAALLEGKETVDVVEAGCYYDVLYTYEEEQLMTFYEQVEVYQARKVAFFFGEDTEKFDAGDLASTLSCYAYFTTAKSKLPDTYEDEFFETVEDSVVLKVDEEKAEAMLDERFVPYNTYRNHTFTTHDGRVLNIKGGTYGNQIDIKTEKKEFLAFLKSENNKYYREPKYTKEAKYKGKNDIGDTYIEVDIGQQKMFYFVDGELYLQTDVVTGKNKATREEVCYVYSKQTDRILRGPGYASPVDYWMPVSGDIGIHDASWRDEYGGDIYLTNGSHGCINTPLDIVAQMYEMVEIGTPCIIYYGLEEE